jgi:hypothetical protein
MKTCSRSSAWNIVATSLLVLIVAGNLVSCAGTPLIGSALEIGRNLLSAAAVNYAPSHAEDLKMLLETLTRPSLVQAEGKSTGSAALEDEEPADTSSPSSGRAAIELDIAIMKEVEVEGRFLPVPIENGEVVRDGGGVEDAGDNLKICFRASTPCFVYVIGIDATGWVSVLYPDEPFEEVGLVVAQKEYLIPEGNVWYFLDQYRGVETVYFVASHERRIELESILTRLRSKTRPAFPPGREVAQVEEVAVVERLRGFAGKRTGRATLVPTRDDRKQEVTPTQFFSEFADADLVITRWFNHVGP